MKRRHFSLTTVSSAAVAAWGLPALAQDAPFVKGKNYTELQTPVSVDVPDGKVEVIEFFWYSCNHCNSLEPQVDVWLQTVPDYLHLRRVPVAFNKSFEPQQKLYYALQGMGRLDDLHPRVFHAIHVERKHRLNKDQQIFDWIGLQGVDVGKFKEMYNSFTVSNQVRRATQLQDAYAIDGVPSMAVAGRYFINGGMAGSLTGMLKVAEYLAAQVHKG